LRSHQAGPGIRRVDADISVHIALFGKVPIARIPHRELTTLGEDTTTTPLEITSLPVATGSAVGRLVTVNDRLCHVLGRSRETLLGGEAVDLFHHEDAPVLHSTWHRVSSGVLDQEVVRCRVLDSQGSWTWARVALTGSHDRSSTVTMFLDLDHPTPGDKDAPASLLGPLQGALPSDQLEVPQVFCDMRGVLVDVNDAFCTLVGESRQRLVGTPVSDLNHRTDDGVSDASLRRLLAGEIDSVRAERVVRAADGVPVPVVVDAAAIRESDGAVIGAVALLRELAPSRAVRRRSPQEQQQDFFHALSMRATDLAIVADATGRILYVSPALQGMLGYTAEQVVNSEGWEFIHPDDISAIRPTYERLVECGGTETFTLRIRDAAGCWRWMEETVTNLFDTAVEGLVCNLRDITERVAANEALRTSEARYRAIAEAAEEGLWVISTEGRTLYANARMADILGINLDEVYRQSVTTLLIGANQDAARSFERRLRDRGSRGSERYELSYEHPDGRMRALWISAAPMFDASGTWEGSLAMISDITESRSLERELRHAALHDSLTGLPNRALLVDRLEHALAQETKTTTVLFIDLDQFKLLNDSLGHDVGDEILAAVAERLRQAARPFDTVARFGGDEFVVIVEDLDELAAHTLAKDILASLAEPYVVEGRVRHTSASIGLAGTPTCSADYLLRNAETAMYSAKAAGRRRVCSFDQKLGAAADERYALSADLRLALAQDTLDMHYQPIIDLRSGDVIGMEALARWNHPSLGPIPPDRFVPVAEETGLARELDRWALHRAIREAGTFRVQQVTAPDAYVAVNLSARNLADVGLESLVADCADAAAVPPQHIVLEITEGAIMDDAEDAIATLRRLRKRGFLVALDDFGTGYSSMAYLRDLPITSLKIDRSFISGIEESREALAIVKSIVELAHAIGATTVAEGVETPEQAARLRTLGCEAAQGWLWSPAVTPDDARSTGALHRTYDTALTIEP
jgi:diguanylate cyclase (GGDEF)-like protein/PAS domain S-box-containing protein